MTIQVTSSILATADQFDADLKALRAVLDMPRASQQKYIASLLDAFVALRNEVAEGLLTRDRLLVEIHDAMDGMQALSERVTAMEAEVRDLRAQVDEAQKGRDPYAGRH